MASPTARLSRSSQGIKKKIPGDKISWLPCSADIHAAGRKKDRNGLGRDRAGGLKERNSQTKERREGGRGRVPLREGVIGGGQNIENLRTTLATLPRHLLLRNSRKKVTWAGGGNDLPWNKKKKAR